MLPLRIMSSEQASLHLVKRFCAAKAASQERGLIRRDHFFSGLFSTGARFSDAEFMQ